uniref:Regulatory protein E2 n=1 Tax=Eidolon bat papillomavirus TaxID=3141875 RepID=A0AAU7E2M2_9PAPI
MTTSLAERFDALQEKELTLIEQDSDNIQAQIEYWRVQRQLNVLLHYARKNNHTTLGAHRVPTLAASEAAAKFAIKMELLLTSLAKSPFGGESWTMQDCSQAVFEASPKDTFKKGGHSFLVYYDKTSTNSYPYVAWARVYTQNENDEWSVSASTVTGTGIFFVNADGDEVQYEDFVKDARRLSQTGTWQVRYKQQVISGSSSGSGTPGSPARKRKAQQPPTRSQKQRREGQEGPQRRGRPRTLRARGSLGGSSSSSGPRTRARGAKGKAREAQGAGGRQGGEGEEEGEGQTGSRGPGERDSQEGEGRKAGESGGEGGGRRGGGGGGGRRGQRGQPRAAAGRRYRRRRGRGPTSTTQTPRATSTPLASQSPAGSRTPTRGRSRRESSLPPVPTPGEVGRRSTTVGPGSRSRLERLLAEARDPPTLLVRGPPNTLKCWRNRATLRYAGYYSAFSSVFKWAVGGAAGSRMLIAFSTAEQRDQFVGLAHFPKGTTNSPGDIYGPL